MGEWTKGPLRLAIRSEGDWIVAYLAPLGTMEGAEVVATLRGNLLHGGEDPLFSAWRHHVQELVTPVIREVAGATPRWGEPEPAPEHERAGRG